MIRLNKYIADCGICSRRQAEDLIFDGEIKVNGEVVNEMGVKIDEQKDKVEYNGRVLKPESKLIYIALNKPEGYITSTTSHQGEAVLDLVKVDQRVYPVGRLDKDSKGLVLLTNDGELTDILTHPKYEHSKEYQVLLDKRLAERDIKKLEEGTMKLDNKKLQAVKIVKVVNKVVTLILKEGVNRQIRRMMGRLGYDVLELKRIRIGNLRLGNLEEGKWREVKKEEII